MQAQESDTESPAVRKKRELRLFLFLAVLLFPLLAIAVVGGYGFAVWMLQIFFGPPGSSA